jgi:hypothetical protein
MSRWPRCAELAGILWRRRWCAGGTDCGVGTEEGSGGDLCRLALSERHSLVANLIWLGLIGKGWDSRRGALHHSRS